MKTAALGIASYCVPCGASCRYCLLASNRRAEGAEYFAAKAFAKRVQAELKRTRPELGFYFYIGYCMDAPYITDYVHFCRKNGFPSGTFLQMNGGALRDAAAWRPLLTELRVAGTETIDATIYGTRSYHDRFAGRAGDYDSLTAMLEAAKDAGIAAQCGIPVTRENLGQLDVLLRELRPYGPVNTTFFLPHSKGRGETIAGLRITRAEYDALSANVRAHFARTELRTEAEWIASGAFPVQRERHLILNVTAAELSAMEKKDAAVLLAEAEAMDDAYLARMPDGPALARRFGDPAGQRLYRVRDLLLLWQQRYIRECDPTLTDMHDERHSFSVHL